MRAILVVGTKKGITGMHSKSWRTIECDPMVVNRGAQPLARADHCEEA
jgi:hypothetical protein